MKIKAYLGRPEEIIDLVKEITERSPEFVKEFEDFGKKHMKAYIELDTGGNLDDLPIKAQEAFGRYVEIILKGFGNKLLAAINFDLVNRHLGRDGHPGFDAIESGLAEIDRGLEIAQIISDPSLHASA